MSDQTFEDCRAAGEWEEDEWGGDHEFRELSMHQWADLLGVRLDFF